MKKGKKKPVIKREPKAKRPEMHAKNVSLIVSIGTDDRDRTIEKMTDELKTAISKLGFKNVNVMSSYYILDGKVCRPEDYDEATQNFKPGTAPPPWAGGPTINTTLERVGQEKFAVSEPKYTPKENMDAIRPILEANAAKKRGRPARDDDDELEEFEWDVEDAADDEKMETVAKKSRTVAIKKLTVKKPTKGALARKIADEKAAHTAKRVIKKPIKKVAAPAASRRVVRRKK